MSNTKALAEFDKYLNEQYNKYLAEDEYEFAELIDNLRNELDRIYDKYLRQDFLTNNPFCVVIRENGTLFLAETKTNFILPIADPKAMCILLNYAIKNQDVPNVDTLGWENKEELQKYYREDKWGRE